MRQRSLLLLALLVFVFHHQQAKAHDAIAPEPTRIETDAEKKQINFYIDGRLMAVLKDDGFHVRDSLNYGGMITDYGQQYFDTLHADEDTSAEGK